MMSARPARLPRRELTASDGFGPLPTIVPPARDRSFTRGLCTFLRWPYRRIAPTPLCQSDLRPTAIALRAVNE
jgi:hypothetical protein